MLCTEKRKVGKNFNKTHGNYWVGKGLVILGSGHLDMEAGQTLSNRSGCLEASVGLFARGVLPLGIELMTDIISQIHQRHKLETMWEELSCVLKDSQHPSSGEFQASTNCVPRAFN